MRKAHHQAMQERAQKRWEALRARWESYRKTVEAMTEEQREAAAAIFGQRQPPVPPRPPMPPIWQNPSHRPMLEYPPRMPSYGPEAYGPWSLPNLPRAPRAYQNRW